MQSKENWRGKWKGRKGVHFKVLLKNLQEPD